MKKCTITLRTCKNTIQTRHAKTFVCLHAALRLPRYLSGVTVANQKSKESLLTSRWERYVLQSLSSNARVEYHIYRQLQVYHTISQCRKIDRIF